MPKFVMHTDNPDVVPATEPSPKNGQDGWEEQSQFYGSNATQVRATDHEFGSTLYEVEARSLEEAEDLIRDADREHAKRFNR